MMKIISPCWKPSTAEPDHAASSHGSHLDGLICYTDLGHHAAGEFSMATIQANNPVEDASQIESGPLGTFIGVYDGHGGPQTSQYITRNLFLNLKNFANEQQGMSGDVIRKAFAATEEGFISTVRKQWLSKPRIALVGSCCLVGVVCGDMVYIANAGDSRAVLGRCERGVREVVAVQMSTEHNVNIEAVRDELRALHPEDSKIVVLRHKVWRVKGVLQVSRSIGDAYLKDAEFNQDPLPSRFRLRRPYKKPILSAEPSILTHKLCPKDQFLIFASDGLWEHLTNQEAVEIVQDSPRNGIARRLVKIALKEAAKKKEMRYADLKNIDCEVRRHFHDDISVVVLFLDPTLINRKNYCGSVLSLRGAGASMQPDPPSRF